MQKITYITRKEAEARHFYNLVNDRHDRLKAKQKTDRTQEGIYQIAKKTLAFGGALLFLLCLWMLR